MRNSVHVLAQPSVHRVFEGFPRVTVDATEYKPSLAKYFREAAKLRRQRFDAALLLKEDSAAHTLICKLAGIPIRVGMTRKWYRSQLTHEVLSVVDGLHEVERNVQLARAGLGQKMVAGPLKFYSSPGAEASAKELLMQHGISAEFAIVHPRTGGTSSGLDNIHVAMCVSQLASNGFQVVLTGPPEAAASLTELAESVGAVSLAGKTPLDVLYEVQKVSSVVVSANTGTMHLAVAAGAPVLMLETTPPAEWRIQRWRPLGVISEAVDLTRQSADDITTSLRSILNQVTSRVDVS